MPLGVGTLYDIAPCVVQVEAMVLASKQLPSGTTCDTVNHRSGGIALHHPL